MKTITLITFITLTTMSLKGQVKTVSLYDLLSIAIPDSTLTDTVYSWSKGLSVYPFAKWETNTQVSMDTRDKNGKLLDEYKKNGSVNLKLNNIKADECELLLMGTSKGYYEFQLDASLPENYSLEKLIGNKPSEIKLIKKDEDIYAYSLKLPGKKEVWLLVFPFDALGDGNKSLEIVCCFNYNDFKTRL